MEALCRQHGMATHPGASALVSPRRCSILVHTLLVQEGCLACDEALYKRTSLIVESQLILARLCHSETIRIKNTQSILFCSMGCEQYW
jgi:hypothetical protein